MKAKLQLVATSLALFLLLCLGVGIVAFPFVFSEAVIANFLRVIELISRFT